MSYLDKLPEELEDYIYKLVHGFYQHDINKFIKSKGEYLGDLDGGVLYEYYYILGLKRVPEKFWGKLSHISSIYGYLIDYYKSTAGWCGISSNTLDLIFGND